jgi:hypothetical protein
MRILVMFVVFTGLSQLSAGPPEAVKEHLPAQQTGDVPIAVEN